MTRKVPSEVHSAEVQRGPRTGIVLSGGGVRGAYEAGVVAGIVEALGRKSEDPAPFSIFTGSSVGAINAAFLATHADRGDLAVDDLYQAWRSLRRRAHIRPDLLRLVGRTRGLRRRNRAAPSLLDPRPLEGLVERTVDPARIARNARSGYLDALVITATEIGTGRSAMFAHMAPGRRFVPSRDPRRVGIETEITAQHVLASSAIPIVFPPRPIGNEWYCDGGLRFNTPLAPALRTGADRLVVVVVSDVRHRVRTEGQHIDVEEYRNVVFLAGKLLDALLVDPVVHDIQILERFNRLVRVLRQELPRDAWERVADTMRRGRGMPYRCVPTLVFAPSTDIGRLAGLHLRQTKRVRELGRLARWLFVRAAAQDATWEADLASYVLFDGDFAATVFELGRQDALARAGEIRAFFAPSARCEPDVLGLELG